jgi:hypothetical protein
LIICEGADVIGCFWLSAGAIDHAASPKAQRRNMPNPLPNLLVGCLAVDRRRHNQGQIEQALRR